MKAGTLLRAFALTTCFAFATSGVALAGSSFTDFTNGVKNLTESAKDVSSLNQEKKQDKKKQTPAQKQTTSQSKKKTPRKQEPVQGG